MLLVVSRRHCPMVRSNSEPNSRENSNSPAEKRNIRVRVEFHPVPHSSLQPPHNTHTKTLTPNIPPIICPIKNMDTIIKPLNTSINSRLHLINASGMAIMMGSVAAVKIIANAPRMNVE